MISTVSSLRLRIGELADQLGINPRTIRYYESIGLLPQPKRTGSGYRLYSQADYERLVFIRKAQGVGMTLEEIGQLLRLRRDGQLPRGYVSDLVEQKLAAVDEQLRALHEFRDDLLALPVEVKQANEATCGDGQVCGLIELHRPDRLEHQVPLTLRRSTRQR